MAIVFVSWAICAAVLVVIAALLGSKTIKRGITGILIDERGRYSLTRGQLTLWTVVIISLIGGVVVGRLFSAPKLALNFDIPPELLGVLGISVSSTALAATIKTSKDNSPQAANVAASNELDRPKFSQMFLVEEGTQADKIVDITKYQNFWFTIILVASYVSLAIAYLNAMSTPKDLTTLPGFSPTFLILLAISHAGYVAGKVPNMAGQPDGLTMQGLKSGAAATSALVPAPAPAFTYVPRNP